MSEASVRRWGRKFVLLWIIVWLSTALLPCSEVLAALGGDESALSSCGHPVAPAPKSEGNRKTGACISVGAPVRAAAKEPAAAAVFKSMEKPAQLAYAPQLPRPSVVQLQPRVFLSAPPPADFYLRSSRLLI